MHNEEHFAEMRSNGHINTLESIAIREVEIIHADSDGLDVSPAEYQQIMDCAHEDGHIDKEEEVLLAQFQAMISNGTIKRVKG